MSIDVQSDWPPAMQIDSYETTTSGKRFPCSHCQRQFSRKEHLQRHQNIHYARKPYRCSQCEYSCRRKDLLRRHSRLVHNSPTAAEQPPNPRFAMRQHTRQQEFNLDSVVEDDNSEPSVRRSPSGDQDTAQPIIRDDTILSFVYHVPTGQHDYSTGQSLTSALPALDPDLNTTELDATSTPITQRSSLADRLSRIWSPEEAENSSDPGAADSVKFPKVSDEDWRWLTDQLTRIHLYQPRSEIQQRIPSSTALSRYLSRFLSCFDPQVPIFHRPTAEIRVMEPELILAMAAVGCHYCLEAHEASKMVDLAWETVLVKVEDREKALHLAPGRSSRESGDPFGHQATRWAAPTRSGGNGHSERGGCAECNDSAWVETMQALFFLMVVATWGKTTSRRVRDLASMQSVAIASIRTHGLSDPVICNKSWRSWAHHESCRRTKWALFCLFSLHSISMNVPPLMLLTELRLRLPCPTLEWEAADENSWSIEHGKSRSSASMFQDYYDLLFHSDLNLPRCSSFGNHVMIHAILQHVFYLHQVSHLNVLQGQASVQQLLSVQRALKRWRSSCEKDPPPQDQPMVSNSTALYRLAYVRLVVKIGPAHSLIDKGNGSIVTGLKRLPKSTKSPLLTLAARHALEALHLATEFGIFIVGQQGNWSVVHAICSLEYCHVIIQFLSASVVQEESESSLGADEYAVLEGIKQVLLEIERCLPDGTPRELPATPELLGRKGRRPGIYWG
ncbi:hypothetical protein FE257_011599 [Aspergillus nanangensis]|uniref:C2H2-type domain-containing protein n=1 Tax=Aspergillus nanangensis TaxID=2582783 RepID=A0AAD4CH10_ASPNN|nr:hypothetical protein FE257_011599 [Aspergillus nanangensis]